MKASIIIGDRTVATLDLNNLGDLTKAFRLVIAMKNPECSPLPHYPNADYFAVADESNNLRLYLNEDVLPYAVVFIWAVVSLLAGGN